MSRPLMLLNVKYIKLILKASFISLFVLNELISNSRKLKQTLTKLSLNFWIIYLNILKILFLINLNNFSFKLVLQNNFSHSTS